MALTPVAATKTIPVRDLQSQPRECPHCHVRVMGDGKSIVLGRSVIQAWSCNSCWNDTVLVARVTSDVNSLQVALGSPEADTPVQVIPAPTAKTRAFPNAPADVMASYTAAAQIAPVHAPAAAAMARKAIERLLESRGYKHKQLVDKLNALANENSPEKRVSLRLIGLATALREFGNIGLHTIRSASSAEILEVEAGEVELCIATVEEMIEELCERPAMEREKMIPIAAKLRDAGKTGAALIVEGSFNIPKGQE